jgi:hypothetical protein
VIVALPLLLALALTLLLLALLRLVRSLVVVAPVMMMIISSRTICLGALMAKQGILGVAR